MMITRLVCAALLVILAHDAHAHHSHVGSYDASKEVTITGRVVQFQLRNPHSVLIVDVPRADGQSERWEIESAAAVNLRRGRGWDENTFKPGDTVTVSGYPHRNPGVKQIAGREFKVPGRTIPRERRDGPAVVQITANNLGLSGISGRWQPPFRGPGTMSTPASGSPLPLTSRGLQAWQKYKAAASPVTTCEPMSLPTLFYPGYYVDIRLKDKVALLYYELYDVTRTIPLNGQPAKATPSGRFGVSTGRIEGNTLVIQTSSFPASDWGLAAAAIPLGNGKDVPSSPQKKVIERYSVSEDGRTLRLDYTVEDPVYLIKPFTDRVPMERLPDDAAMYEFKCDPQAAARFTGVRAPADARPSQGQVDPK